MFESGRYVWNTGYFVTRTGFILSAYQKLIPEMWAGLQRISSAIGQEDYQEVLDREYPQFQTISFDDAIVQHLSAAELEAVDALLAAGRIMHAPYEQQLHEEAEAAKRRLEELHAAAADPGATRNLLDLYYLFKGPVATTLDNERLAFLPPFAPAAETWARITELSNI